ncbi:MAG: hypothetical protein EP343_24835 [Deltaproteobacteria bacterium]|nr:MAG: hypothetical protein EP343_24835 [Deltaproteobacteria bacterium]
MSTTDSRIPERYYCWGLFLFALCTFSVHLYFAWQPLDKLLSTFAADDMFYYMQIARNIAEGNGSTFDGVTPTNGYHPVYMLVVLAVFGLFPGKSAAFYPQMSLTLLSVAGVATSFLLFAIVRRLANLRIAFFVASAWLLNPYILATVQLGVEVPLSAFMFALSLWAYLRFSDNWLQRTPRYLESFGIGVLLGVTCLCRTDSMFFAICLGLATLYSLYRLSQASSWWLHVVTFGAGGAAVIFPWFGWNLWKFGSIVQDSARALTTLKHDVFLDKFGWSGVIQQKWPFTFMEWMKRLTNILCSPSVWITGALLLLLVWGVVRTVLQAKESEPLHNLTERAAIVALLGAYLMVMGFYVGYFWFMQKWYFLSPTLLLLVLAGVTLFQLEKWVQTHSKESLARWVHIVAWVTAIALFLGTAPQLFRRGFHPWQKHYHDIAVKLRSTKKSGKVGAFNSGIYGYVLNQKLVNLDGVVNGQVLKAMKKHKLFAYLKKRNVTWIVDHLDVIQFYGVFAEPSFRKHLALKGRFGSGRSGSDIVLLKVMKKPPQAPTQR